MVVVVGGRRKGFGGSKKEENKVIKGGGGMRLVLLPLFLSKCHGGGFVRLASSVTTPFLELFSSPSPFLWEGSKQAGLSLSLFFFP